MASTKSKTIVAVRDGDTREFAKDVWDALPENKYGWKEKYDAPEEVKNLHTGTAKSDANANADEPSKVNAADLAKQIYEAETAEAVDALVPHGETRVTVLKAAEERKKQLSETK